MFRRIEGLLRKHLFLIILIVGGIYAANYFGLLSIFAGESTITWQGQEWAYKTESGVPSIDGDSATLSIGCSTIGGGCNNYLRSDFDISQYSEINLLMTASSSVSTGESSESSAHARISFGDKDVMGGVSSTAIVRGGTNIPGDSDSLTQTATLKRNGQVWDIYLNSFKIATINNNNPELKAYVLVSGNYGSGNARLTMRANFKSPALNFAPTVPAAPLLASFAATLKSWLRSLFDLIPFLTITGAASPALGSTQTYAASITAPASLDADHTDGTFAVRYCNIALLRSDGTAVAEKGFESCTSSVYSTSLTATVPSSPGKYAVAAVMVESKGTFDVATQTWVFAPYEIIAQEALNVETKAPIPGSSLPLKPTSSNIFARIWQNLFGWLFR